jgi:hypothetical protein
MTIHHRDTEAQRIFVAFFLCGSVSLWLAFGQMKGPIVRQVDNVLIETGDPAGLFGFFAETLQLPVAWPLSEKAGAITGGIGLGDVTLEMFKPGPKKSPTRFAGLALEPYSMNDAVRELELRAIPFSPPQKSAVWTTVTLTAMTKADFSVFLREYSPDYLNPAIRRKQFKGRLALTGGGPLGVESIREIVIGSAAFEADLEMWRKLLTPSAPAGTTVFQPTLGPPVRIVKDVRDRIQSVVLKVRSLDQARSFLQQQKMLGSGMTLLPSRIGGLTIRLTN